MSYIRAGHPMQFVEGISNDYVFLSAGCNCEKMKEAIKNQNLRFNCPDHPNFIEDYDKLTNEGLVEIFAKWFKTEDRELYDYILKKLAEKLNVKLRRTKLEY